MNRKLCLLTVLMLTVAANVAWAGIPVTESFGTSGIIDEKGPGNETPVTQTASGLTWGGYDNYVTDNTREQNVKISNGGLHFEPRMVNESIGYYGYTSWVGIKPSLDMTGAAIDFMASSESVPTDLGTDVEILLRAGGVWYVSDSVVNIKDDVSDTKKPYSFDLATTTWTAVDTATNTMLDNLLNGGGDEGPLVLGTPAAGAPDLSDVTGGGFRGASDPGNNDDVKIDDIVWDQNPLLNIDPLVTINGKETDVRYAHIVTYSSSTDTKPLLNWDEFTDGDGWQAINNAKATDGDGDPLTYTWAVTDYVGTDAPSEQEAIDNVLFRRNNRDEATDVIDPNIIYPYRGTYTVTLTAEDSEASDVATLTQHVVTNRAPRVVNVAGDNSREVYAGDTIEKLNPTIRDDNYPLTDPLTTQQFSVISGPAPLSFNFNGVTTTDSFEGIGKTHPLIPERQPEDPNVTFPAGFVGVYEIRIQAHDGELGSWQSATDLEQIVTVTVIDNKAMTDVDAGEDQIASLLAGGQITLEGSITDPDPEIDNKTVAWYVDEGPSDVVISLPMALDSTATFDTLGEYTLRLQVQESSLSTGIIDANDTMTVTVYPAAMETAEIIPEDDASVRNGSNNYGAASSLHISAKNSRQSYIQFDLNQIPGNIYEAYLEVEANGEIDQNTLCWAVTYGPSGDWDEGTGTGTVTDDGITGDNDDLVVGDLLERKEVTWAEKDRKLFDVMDMVIESDRKVTFKVDMELRANGTSDNDAFRSKENSDNKATPPENGPKLILTYDPNQAYWPSPEEDAVNTAPLPTLRWKLNSQTSYLYLATSESALDAMVTPTAIVSNDPNGTWTPPSKLEFGQEHWWRIDGDNNSVGEKWKFTVMMMNTAPVITLTPNPLNNVYLKFNDTVRVVGSDADKAAVEAKGNKVHLVASAVDADEYPNPILTYTWSKISGPGTASFNPDNDPNTFITLSEPGTYEILFQAYDGEDEANDILVINAPWEPLPASGPILPSDDAYTRSSFGETGSNPESNNGARDELITKHNDDPTNGGHYRTYLKFDLSSIVGNIESATLELEADGGIDADTIIYATTYGPSGEWFEGNGDTSTEPITLDTAIPPGITGATNDLVQGAIVASTTESWARKERKQFDVSGLVIESDGKVTLQVFTNQDTATERFRSKENTDNDVQPGENAATLTVIYDPNIAYAYGIADGATGVSPHPTLSWKTGPISASSTVYFGTSEDDLTLGDWTITGSGDMSLDLAASLGYDLLISETYYWQIVSSIPGGDGDSDVFSFTVTDTNPNTPILQAPDGGTLVLPIDLSWAASENATGYDLSIGTDPTAVTDFSAAVIAVGNVLTVQTADLDLETTYYWTVRGTHPSMGPWKAAEVFSFTTDNYEVLDDFEAGVGSWTAGGGTTAISVGTIVDNGSGSLKLDFDDTSAVSTATLALASRDLTSGGRAALRFAYHGHEGNGDEQTLYVAVTGSSGTVADSYEILEDITEYSWKGWDDIHLDLGDFAGAGLDAVTQFTIGIGEGSGGETGTLYIDDVRLYVQRCVTSTVPGYFIGGDCYADEPNELLALSERWLAGPVTVDAASAPPLDDTLLLHFTFDEDANDVYYSNTTAIGETLAVVGNGAPKWGQDPPDRLLGGTGGTSIHVTRADSITIVSPDLSSADTSATLSMWVKGDELTDLVKANGKLPQRELLRVSTTDNAQYWKVLWPNAGGSVKAQGGGGSYNSTVPDDFELWRHLAIVRDGDNGTAAFYVDGVKVAHDGFWLSDSAVVNPFPGPDVTGIPIPRNKQFDGHIDEFRFYGSALSQAEIIWLANLPSVTQPVLGTGPDTNNDGSFDYEDLADLAEVWYKEVLFPPTP